MTGFCNECKDITRFSSGSDKSENKNVVRAPHRALC
jgi:hypothetical protein